MSIPPAPMALSPTQQIALDEINNAISHGHPAIRVRPGEGRSSGGAGITTVLHAIQHHTFLSVGDVLKASVRMSTQPPVVSLAFDLALRKLPQGQRGVLVVDDLDLCCAPETVRLPNEGDSDRGTGGGGGRRDGAWAMLYKSLIDEVVREPGRTLVFASMSDDGALGCHCYDVTIGAFTPEDYAFFVRAWVPRAAEKIDCAELHRAFPALTPAELRTACVPSRGESEADLSTSVVIEHVASRLGEAHGAVSLRDVENVDISQMPGVEATWKTVSEASAPSSIDPLLPFILSDLTVFISHPLSDSHHSLKRRSSSPSSTTTTPPSQGPRLASFCLGRLERGRRPLAERLPTPCQARCSC